MTTSPNPEHRIRWYVRLPGDEDWTPKTAKMRGTWGYDVKCSCGMETHTGGATKRSIEEMIWAHRTYGEDSGWSESR